MRYFKSIISILFTLSLTLCSPPEIQNRLAGQFKYSTDKKVFISVHRGGKGYAGYPENCLETIKFVNTHIPNAIFEIDIAQSKDSILFLMHDDNLERTTTGSGRANQLNWKELEQLKLKDDFNTVTLYHIPLFKKVIDWAKTENAILTIDIKRSVDPVAVLNFIEKHQALEQLIMITYSIETAQKLYKANPNVFLSVTIRNMDEFERFEKSGIPWKNIMAFTGISLTSPLLYKKLHRKGVMCILGTMGNLDRKAETKGDHFYKEWANTGIDIFSTDRALEAFNTLN